MLDFKRRRRQLGDAIVGRGSSLCAGRRASSRNFHRPVASFSTAPRAASWRSLSPVSDRLEPAALASAMTLKPGLSTIAASSLRSAVLVEVFGLPRLILPT